MSHLKVRFARNFVKWDFLSDFQTLCFYLKFWGFVFSQSVIHVESIKLDFLQVETTIYEHPEKKKIVIVFNETTRNEGIKKKTF